MLKPALTDDQQVTQIEYCLWNCESNGEFCSDMLDHVHVDEKWFFMQEDGTCFLLAPNEEPPHCTTCHKGYIGKVMFLSAIARLWKIRGQWWDGKIGIWPIGEMDYAQKSSKNRPKSTPIWVN